MNILGAASIGRALWDAMLMRRLLLDAAFVGIFTIITGMLAGALVIGACYGLMVLLVNNGLEPVVAWSMVGGVVAVLALLAAWCAVTRIRRMRRSVSLISGGKSQISDIASAFLDGLRGGEPRRR